MRRPVWALHALAVGLALHNLAMAELWDAGVRGAALDVLSAWKEALAALCLVALFARGLRAFRWRGCDALALAYAAVVVVWALLPQGWLGGHATARGAVLGARHDLVPVAAYFLGRGLALADGELRRLGATVVAAAAGVAAFGLVDVYAIPLSWWRGSGAPGWFRDQLGFHYFGLSGLPENFVYNTGDERPLRRLVSTFLSPLASSYMLVVALLLAAAWLLRRRPPLALWVPVAALLLAGLLWTHARSSFLALALGLTALALARREAWLPLVAAAAVVLVTSAVFVRAYPHVAPSARFTPSELAEQRRHAHETGRAATSGLSDASISSHWRSLRAGIRTVLRHPQGFGVGNAGSTAARTGVEVEAGESTYTELGVDAGLAGALLFAGWSLVLLRVVLPRVAWVGAALAAVLALGLQTDVVGVPWLAYVVFALAGTAVTRALPPPARTGPS
ncbi:MAG TPA: O-antigen ligase family protein [Gaiellaceae bacterium]|nr:O-antigen ligase family protein [Gaiellaceae bacterium]